MTVRNLFRKALIAGAVSVLASTSLRGAQGTPPAAVEVPRGKPCKLFLLGGQSNMDGCGRAGDLPEAFRTPPPNVVTWDNRRECWVPLTGDSMAIARQKQFGPEMAFSHALAEAFPGHTIALTKTSAGGTKLHTQWVPGKGMFERFIRNFRNAARHLDEAGVDYEIGGMLWMQGESDSETTEMAGAYERNLKLLVADLRRQTGRPALPVVMGRISSSLLKKTPWNFDHARIVQSAQEAVAAADAHVHIINTDALGTLPDNTHFNSEAQLTLGRQMAGIMLRELRRPEPPSGDQAAVDWPAFMARHDMHFEALPRNWREAPHFGNAAIGSMLYRDGKGIKLQVFRNDVHDHRDDSWGWPAYSRPRLRIGHFLLEPVGTLTGCQWRKDLWNAELTGTITTDQGTIKIRHFTHAGDMAIVTELTPSGGEQGCRWTWHPMEAKTSRPGYPTEASQVAGFAKRYGAHHAETLKLWKPNPAGRLETRDGVSVWIQDFLVGGQYATAWSESNVEGTRTHLASIAHSYPESTAATTAAGDVARCLKRDRRSWVDAHRDWWHDYFPRSFVSIPDKSLESLYWQTIYRFGCTSRTGRYFVDTSGMWFQGGPWAYTTTNWNIQSAHWPVCTANRLEQGQDVLERFHTHREALIKAVRPVEWQKDSAYLAHEVAGDMAGNRAQDMRYYDEVGNLPWTLNNCWSQYRYSMDDTMLREKLYPLLRRSINLYLHMVEEGEDGKLHLPPTYSPETSVWEDANFDLALFSWGCLTLLKASKRLGIDDPLIPRWQEVAEKLVDFPADEHGFRLGSNQSSSPKHRHLSNLLMIYPLHLVNIEQEGSREVLQASYERAHAITGLPAMVQTHAGPIGTALGRGDTALEGLKLLQGDLHPNGLWSCGGNPCIESTLGMAAIVQDMLLQSWSDPAREESGPIRIFPALPTSWKDVEFRDLRAEGAFLVSAERRGGRTEWVEIKSLAGEPCRVRPGMTGGFQLKGTRKHQLEEVSPGIYQIDLKKGEEVRLDTK